MDGRAPQNQMGIDLSQGVMLTAPVYTSPFYMERIEELTIRFEREGIPAHVGRLENATPFAVETLSRYPAAVIMNMGTELDPTQFPNLPQLHWFGSNVRSDGDHVRLDVWEAARMATNHLLDAGYEKVAYITFSAHAVMEAKLPHFTERLSGYARAMRDRSLPARLIVSPGIDQDEIQAHLRGNLQKDGLPEAAVCFNDRTARVFVRVAHGLGYSVPRDCGLVSIDNNRWVSQMVPSLTSVGFDYGNAADLVVESVIRRAAEPDLPLQHFVLTPEIHVRESSVRPA